MSEFFVIRVGNGLYAGDETNLAALLKLPYDRPILIEARAPRNGAHHRLYWALCHRIADAVGSTSETVSDLLKINTGHCHFVSSKNHGYLKLPKSISFAAMDQTEFSAFFERCLVCIYEEWGIERKDIIAAIEDLLVPTEGRG